MLSKPQSPITDQNLVKLPQTPSKIGVFVSGGLDSALLYHFLTLANSNGHHTIVPITVVKNSQTLNIVKTLLSYYNYFGEPLILNGTVPEAVVQCYNMNFNKVYLGSIKELPEFLVGWSSSTYSETKFFKTPFKNLDKRQIVKLVIDQKLQRLFEITHSCATREIGRCNTCNRCRERKWAFEQLDLVDPGVL